MTEIIGLYETPEGGYGSRQRLSDGTEVNVVTIFTGPGIACDTEIEAGRLLTEEEIDAVMDADCVDHQPPTAAYEPMPPQHYF